MLVLTRKVGESIMVYPGGKALEVKVLGVKGGTAVLGFDAPREVQIARKELIKETEA